MEAMAVGLPVVSTRVSAIPELVEDGATGLLVDPASPDALAEALKRSLLRPAESRERAERARKRVETDFDNRRCVERLHALFRERLQKP
jgi:glycosyltransferase involved in cell wall biosynthesis